MRIYGTSPLYNYVELIFRCKRMFILAIIIGTLITSYMLQQRTDKYQVSMVIALTGKPEVGTVSGQTVQKDTIDRKASQLMFWLKEVPDFAIQVAKNANLDQKHPTDFDETVKQLRDGIATPQLSMGQYLRINMVWPKPEEAERVLSELFTLYRNKLVDQETAGQTEFRRILELQFKKAEKDANAIQQEKMRYTVNNYYTQSSFLASTVTKADQAESAIQNAQTDIEELRARLAGISIQLQSTAPEVIVDKTTKEIREDPTLKLKAELEDEQKKLTQLLQVYSQAHPSVQKQQKAVDALNERIAEKTGKPANDPNQTTLETHKAINPEYQKLVSLQNEYAQGIKAYTRRLENLQQTKVQSESRLRMMPQEEIKYSQLMRDFTIKDGLRRSRQSLLASARVQEETDKLMEQNSVGIVVPPSAEKMDAGGKKAMLLAVGPLMGILIAFCFSLLAEALDHTLRTPVEVEKYLGKPVLAVIPRMKAAREAHKQIAGSTKPSITS